MTDLLHPLSLVEDVEPHWPPAIAGTNRTLSAALMPDASLAGIKVHSRRRRPGIAVFDRLPPAHSKALRLHTVCPYYTMFPLNFPFDALADAEAGDWVLDPFCGRGTTTFAARLRGLPSISVDSNPVAAAVAAAKLASPSIEEVLAVAEEALSIDEPIEVPSGRFWELCYAGDTLLAICRLRRRLLRSCTSDAEVVLRALVLGILHGPRQKNRPAYLSAQMPRTYATKPASAIRYWRRKGMRFPPNVDVLDAVARRARFTLAEIPPVVGGVVHFGDCRTIALAPPSRGRFGWVITSPPYFGMRTYRADQWLRNWFLGGPSEVDYSQDGQLSHQVDQFAEQLALVWRNVASACRLGARLIVRFGCIPSCPTKPEELLVRSLQQSDRSWNVASVRDGGSALSGKRQSKQFGRTADTAEQEIDLVATLEA